jgi:hypothetical protein
LAALGVRPPRNSTWNPPSDERDVARLIVVDAAIPRLAGAATPRIVAGGWCALDA